MDLNEYAAKLLATPGGIQGAVLLAFIVGAIWGAIQSSPKHEMRRGPYFVGCCLILVISRTAPFVLQYSEPAYFNGTLPITVFGLIAINVMLGFWYCVNSLARARDAFVVANRAFLAFIPVVNFVLILTPSEGSPLKGTSSSWDRFSYLLMGIIILVVTSVGSNHASMRIQQKMDSSRQPVFIDYITFKQQVMAYQYPIQVDEITHLTGMEVERDRLIYSYEIVLDGSFNYLEEEVLINDVCASGENISIVLKSGFEVVHEYKDTNGNDMGRFVFPDWSFCQSRLKAMADINL